MRLKILFSNVFRTSPRRLYDVVVGSNEIWAPITPYAARSESFVFVFHASRTRRRRRRRVDGGIRLSQTRRRRVQNGDRSAAATGGPYRTRERHVGNGIVVVDDYDDEWVAQ